MLSIYVHGKSTTIPYIFGGTTIDDGGFLDVPGNALLTMESFTDAWQQQEGEGEYSIPLDVVWTDNNRRLLNFSERIENFTPNDNFWYCTVYDNNFPEMVYAKLTIIGKAGNFNYRQGNFKISIAGTKGIFASAIKNKKLANLTLGGNISVGLVGSYREYAQQHYVTNYINAPQIRFAPVGFEGFFNQERTDFNGEFIAKDIVNNVVLDGSGGWEFGRPNQDNPTVAVTDKTQDAWKDYRTIPFFTLKFIIKNIFEENGFNISGEFLTNPDFDNLVLFNNYALERYGPGIFEYTDNPQSIQPSNHMPDMLVSDFIKAIFSGLSMFPIFTDSNNVVLQYNKVDVESNEIAAIDDICSDVFESNFTDGAAAKAGYKISYTADSNDQYFAERVKDITGRSIVATVNTLADLATVPSSGLTVDNLVFVQAENLYYQPADVTVIPVVWEPIAENLQEYVQGTGERTVELGFSTLATYVVKDEATGLYTKQNCLGTRQLGSYFTNKYDRVINPFGLRLFYCTPPGNAAVVPQSYYHNTDANNTSVEKYSLAVKGANSLISLHKPWQDVLQNAEVVKTSVAATQKAIELFRQYRKVSRDGTVFMLKKVTRKYPLGSDFTVELVPL